MHYFDISQISLSKKNETKQKGGVLLIRLGKSLDKSKKRGGGVKTWKCKNVFFTKITLLLSSDCGPDFFRGELNEPLPKSDLINIMFTYY